MNKRAKKRVKGTIEKKNLERAQSLKEQSRSSSPKEQRERSSGFTARPDKKRG